MISGFGSIINGRNLSDDRKTRNWVAIWPETHSEVIIKYDENKLGVLSLAATTSSLSFSLRISALLAKRLSLNTHNSASRVALRKEGPEVIYIDVGHLRVLIGITGTQASSSRDRSQAGHSLDYQGFARAVSLPKVPADMCPKRNSTARCNLSGPKAYRAFYAPLGPSSENSLSAEAL